MSKLNQASEATECQPLIEQRPKTETTATNNDVEAGDDDDDEKPVLATTAGKKTSETILEDAIDILKIGFPIFISSISWVGVSAIVLVVRRG